MTFRIFFTFVLLFLSFISLIWAYDVYDQPSLQLNELIQSVIERNPNLEATQFRIQAAAIAILRVQVPPDPQLTIMSDQNSFHTSTEFTPMMKYEIGQLIPFPGKLSLKGKIAEQALILMDAEKITTCRELVLQTKRLYFRLYLNYVARRINGDNQQVVSKVINDALAVYQSGKGGYEEVLKAQIESQFLNEQLVILESEQISIISMLNAILDQQQTAPLGVPQETWSPRIDFNYEMLEKIAMRERSELHGMQAMIEEQYLMAKLARKEFYPDVMISAGYEKMNHNFAGHRDDAWTATISLNLPIWIRERQQREIYEAQAKAGANIKVLQGMRAMIQGQIREILAKIKSMEERIVLYQTLLIPKTVETLSVALSKYRAGKGDFLLLLDTRRQLYNYELGYEQMRIERETLLAELERAIGVPLEEIICR